jgi:hypothetical protein
MDAHGGLERWRQLSSVSAHLLGGGALWGLKGKDGVLNDIRLTEAGAAKLRKARPAWERAQERMRSRMPDGAWSGLLAALPDLARLADEA